MTIKIVDWQHLSSSCGFQYLIAFCTWSRCTVLCCLTAQEETGLCAWHAVAIAIGFLGNENVRMSSEIDNLESEDLKINLKSLCIIYKKIAFSFLSAQCSSCLCRLLKVSDSIWKHLESKWTAFWFSTQSFSKIKMTLLIFLISMGKSFKTFFL